MRPARICVAAQYLVIIQTMFGWSPGPALDTPVQKIHLYKNAKDAGKPARRTSRSVMLQAALVALSSACGHDFDEVEGEIVTYHFEDGMDPCKGTPDFVDGFARFVAEELGLQIEKRIDYYWMTAAEYSNSVCPSGTAGCQLGKAVRSRYPSLLHEMVHAVTEQNGMNNLPFFTEGLAVALDPWPGGASGPRFKFNPAPGEVALDPRNYITMDSGSIPYEVAGSFVTSLLLRHGPEKFVSLTRKVGASASYSGISKVFAQIYGISLDDEAQAFIDNKYCSDGLHKLPIYDCVAPEIQLRNSSWVLRTTMDCQEGDIAGGTGSGASFRSQASFTLEVPTSGQYELVMNSEGADGDVVMTLGQCFGCPWYPKDLVMTNSGTLTVSLSAGRHFLRITAPSDDAPDLEVKLAPQ